MFCPNCGKEVTDERYCPHCGEALPEREEKQGTESPADGTADSMLDAKASEDPRSGGRKSEKESGKKKSRGGGVQSVGKQAATIVGKTSLAAGKTAGTAVRRTAPFLLRIFSAVLMGTQLAALAREFWIERGVLGPIRQAIPDRNYAELLYLGLVCATLAFGAISLLWMLTRRPVAGDGKVVKADRGRGLTAFVLFFLLGLGADWIAAQIPYAPEFGAGILNGLDLYLVTAGSLQSILCGSSLAGVVCCVIRRLL